MACSSGVPLESSLLLLPSDSIDKMGRGETLESSLLSLPSDSIDKMGRGEFSRREVESATDAMACNNVTLNHGTAAARKM
jgi:hypothetical protein